VNESEEHAFDAPVAPRRRLVLGLLVLFVVLAAIVVAVVIVGDGADRTSPPSSAPVSVSPTLRSDSASQSTLVRAIHDLKSQYRLLRTYSFVSPSTLVRLDPGLTVVNGTTPVDRPTKVSVAVAGQSATAAAESADGDCWYVLDAEPGAPVIAEDDLPGPAVYFNMRPDSPCSGSSAPGSDWTQTFPRPQP